MSVYLSRRENWSEFIWSNWLTQFWRLVSSESAGHTSSLCGYGEDLMLQFKSKGSLEAEFPHLRGRSVFSNEALQMIGWRLPPLRRVICFPPALLILNVSSLGKKNKKQNYFKNSWVSWSCQVDRKISHHRALRALSKLWYLLRNE